MTPSLEPRVAALLRTGFHILAACLISCGDDGQSTVDIVIIPPDSAIETSEDAAADVPGGPDTVPDDVGHHTADTTRDIVPDVHYADLSGTDYASYECESDDDCPQSGKPCEHVSCLIAEHVCVQNNSAKSGNICDEGYKCRTDGRCSGGICVYGAVECADCGDTVCFSAGENCRDCPLDCGTCPEHESDCRDRMDDDMDDVTDCDDTEDCGDDPRCGDWKCISYTPDDTIACGQSVTGDPMGMPFYPDELACGQVPGDWSLLYEFTSQADNSVTVRLTPLDKSEKFRVFVLEGQCNPAYCMGFSPANGSFVFDAKRGWTYYLVVDLVSDGMDGVTAELSCD